MDDIALVADPRRREILRLTWEHEVSAGEIARALPVSFGAVSQHLKALRDAGLVDVRAEGRRRFYIANRARLGPLAAALEQSWAASLDRLAAAIEVDAPALDGDAHS